VAAIGAATAAPALGCSVELDPSLMRASADASLDHRGAGGGGSGEAGDVGEAGADATVSVSDAAPMEGGAPEATATDDSGLGCTTDLDCQSSSLAGACVTSTRCDPTWHLCMTDVCDAGACKASSCDQLAKTCGAATAYGFSVSMFPVPYGGVGGWGPAYAIAAAYPFVFILTTNGVVAYDVVNPTDPAPPMVPVHGIAFIPVSLVMSGRRVYFISGVEGGGPTYRQAIAWLDVPGDPFRTSFTATSAWIGTTQPSLDNALSDPTGGIDLVFGSAFEPTSNLTAPIDDSTMLMPSPVAGLTAEAGVVAATGTQLVAYRHGPANKHAMFSIVSGFATNAPQATREQGIASYGQLDNQAAFALGNGSGVLWTSAPLRVVDGGTNGVSSARLTWLVPIVDAGPEAGLFDTSAHVDLESYPAATSAVVVGSPAQVDADTAIALAAVGQNPMTTSVQVFTRSTPMLQAGKRAVIPVPPSLVGVSVSNGFGYLLAQDNPQNRSATVYIVASGCVNSGNRPGTAGAAPF
jgi:hypothetical protein